MTEIRPGGVLPLPDQPYQGPLSFDARTQDATAYQPLNPARADLGHGGSRFAADSLLAQTLGNRLPTRVPRTG